MFDRPGAMLALAAVFVMAMSCGTSQSPAQDARPDARIDGGVPIDAADGAPDLGAADRPGDGSTDLAPSDAALDVPLDAAGEDGELADGAGAPDGTPADAPAPAPDLAARSRQLDLLFLIDDSPSMIDKQQNLRRNFPVLIDELKKLPGGLPDLHIGVITSDLGAGLSALSGQCYPGGKRAILRAAGPCATQPNDRFLVAGEGVNPNFTGSLSDAFSCLANVGDMGCIFEHQLQALRVALYDVGSGDQHLNKGFLRDDAYLAMVILTDEDDCSADQTSDLFTDDTPFVGTSPSFRCAQVGHQCNGQAPPVAAFDVPLATCQAKDGGRLIRVAEIIDSIRMLKARPDQQIFVSAITGWPADPSTARYTYGIAPGSTDLDYLPVCAGSSGSATAALRIKQFVDAFGAHGSLHSICDADFAPAMQALGDQLAAVMRP
jgi:hypothetical protein